MGDFYFIGNDEAPKLSKAKAVFLGILLIASPILVCGGALLYFMFIARAAP